ncbi:MAG: methyltransferase domain-containing protein [Acidobacteria bacterium]|nr:methyltransferase domain-containing protein [Acidobacteriota bacterium]
MLLHSFDDLVRTMRSFQASRILLTAVELDVFTAVGAGATGAQAAAKLGAGARSTEMLLNALAALGALTKAGDVFHNTPVTARHLVAGSPEYARPELMHTVNLWSSWTTLTECVRADTAVLPPGIDGREEEWTRSFIAAMHSNARTRAGEMVRAAGAERVRRLLDIGGGSGAYSIAFAQANPNLRAEVFDLAPVLAIAREHIAGAGLAGRISTRSGDLRTDEFGAGYDLILLSAICHMLSAGENRDLLRRCGRALAPGGRVLIRDFILDPGRTSPVPAALFALNMLVATRGGSTYTLAEYTAWLEEAGFGGVERPDPAGDLITAGLQTRQDAAKVRAESADSTKYTLS